MISNRVKRVRRRPANARATASARSANRTPKPRALDYSNRLHSGWVVGSMLRNPTLDSFGRQLARADLPRIAANIPHHSSTRGGAVFSVYLIQA